MSNKKIPVIIDCDPGIDDAMALMAAFSFPNLDIKAITTVSGNVSIEKVTVNARSVLGTLGVQSKIYKGAKGPLMCAETIEATEVHGTSGLGYYALDEAYWHPLEKISALEAQKQILEEASVPVTIIATGPLTNIALLIKSYPNLINKIDKISLMGGGFFTGNHTPAAEFNIFADPESAEIVYQSGIPIIMAGLDVTHQAKIFSRDVEEIRSFHTPVSDMMTKILDFHFADCTEEEKNKKYTYMHDALAVFALVRPDMFNGENLKVTVETGGKYSRGYTLADFREDERGKDTNCYVLLGLDRDKFYNEVLKAIQYYK